MTKLLFVVSSADRWTLADGTSHDTGYWAEELVEAHRAFIEAGFDVAIATPHGRTPVVDQASLSVEALGAEAVVNEYREYIKNIEQDLQSALVVEEQVVDPWDAIFFPGGHAPMEDLAVSEYLGRLLVGFLDSEKPIAAVCHASAALLPAYRIDESWPFTGYSLTGFTNQEERLAGFADQARWLVESELKSSGAKFIAGPAWEPNVVVDRLLITGQNPASSKEVAQQLITVLNRD
ncbi:MAG: type 1 glutamine amidotransferase domain-containing protein [Mycobacteriaceae bacterium]